MLRVSLLCRVAPPERQQRLYTGALFPEDVNRQLSAFAARQGLTSAVWAPHAAFERALRPLHVHILPAALFCDVSASTAVTREELTQAIGREGVLVNAQQTTHPRRLEAFRSLVSPLAAGRRRGAGPRRPAIGTTDSPPELPSPPLHHPLTHYGAPILDAELAPRLVAHQQEHGYRSNYWWQRRRGHQTAALGPGDYRNAEETPFPGRFNPAWCVCYAPRTRTGLPFPPLTAQQMRQRAVVGRYASRTWLTLDDAQSHYGVWLRPERARDGPPVRCGHFTAGREPLVYYCASQFEGWEERFPTRQEMDLAARGVWVAPEKLRGYPLLTTLLHSSERHDAGGDDNDRQQQQQRQQGEWHARFLEATRRLNDIQLLGLRSNEREAHLLASGLGDLLRRQCILLGFHTPHFVSANTLREYAIGVRCGAQGVVHDAPVRVPALNATVLSSQCWYNVAQLEEPAVALQLFTQRPRHVLSHTPLRGEAALLCARQQLLLHRGGGSGGGENWWIQLADVWALGLALNPRRAVGAHLLSPSSSGTTASCDPWSVYFHWDDVALSKHAKSWFTTYQPVDEEGHSLHGWLRRCLTMRAYERGYTSRLWIRTRLDVPLSNGGDGRLREAPCATRGPAGCVLRGKCFAHPLLVCVGGMCFANSEELPEGKRPQLCRNSSDCLRVVRPVGGGVVDEWTS